MGFVSENATEKFTMRFGGIKQFFVGFKCPRDINTNRNDSYNGNLNCSVWFFNVSQRVYEVYHIIFSQNSFQSNKIKLTTAGIRFGLQFTLNREMNIKERTGDHQRKHM